MSSGLQTASYQLRLPKRTAWASVGVAFIACDADGCEAFVAAHDAGDTSPASDIATEEGWDVGDGGSDPDYCPAHKHLRKTEAE